MRKSKIILILIILESSVALAYIDPGTGGMIASSIWPFVVGVLTAIGGFFVRYFFKPIKRTFLKVCKKEKRS